MLTIALRALAALVLVILLISKIKGDLPDEFFLLSIVAITIIIVFKGDRRTTMWIAGLVFVYTTIAVAQREYVDNLFDRLDKARSELSSVNYRNYDVVADYPEGIIGDLLLEKVFSDKGGFKFLEKKPMRWCGSSEIECIWINRCRFGARGLHHKPRRPAKPKGNSFISKN